MYKKLHIFALMALVLVSCSKQEAVRDVAVQFNASICPDMTVLVRGAETQAEQVIANHVVLQAWNGNTLAAEVEQSIVSGTDRISFSGIKLAAGVEYLICIWADCNGCYDTHDLRNVSVAGSKLGIRKGSEFDAFCYCSAVVCRQNDEVRQVTLKRPFAKVSFSAAVEQSVTISYTAPTALDLTTGELGETKSIVEYTVSPDGQGVNTFDYVFATDVVTYMNYTFKLGEEEKATSAPVQKNTKTNIIYKVNNQ